MIKKWVGPPLLMTIVSCQSSVDPPSGYQGVVEFEERLLAFEFSGRLLSVKVDEGDQVRAGALVAEIDDKLARTEQPIRQHEAEALQRQAEAVGASARPAEVAGVQAKIRAAHATEQRLEQNLTRERELLRAGAVPRASVDDLEQELERARAERQALEETLLLVKQGARKEEVSSAFARAEAGAASRDALNERLEHYRLKALAPGQVLEVFREPGEFVAAGAPVLALADTFHPYVDVFVPQGEVSALSVGQKMRVVTDGLGTRLDAKVENISAKLEFSPRFLFSPQERPNLVARVRVRIDDPKRQLRAGLPAFATVGSTPDVIRHD